MNRKFGQIVVVLTVAAVGYSVLSTPGSRFDIDVMMLKQLLLYLLLGASAVAAAVIVRRPEQMNRKFGQIVIILVIASVGYCILSTPGDRLAIDVLTLKRLLLYVLLGACALAVVGLIRPPGPPRARQQPNLPGM